jgi:hypothetical protein
MSCLRLSQLPEPHSARLETRHSRLSQNGLNDLIPII